jgi:hypothetical protein
MNKKKIYVASSWRNYVQPWIVSDLRKLGHEVYDFKNPPHGRGGFAWSEIDPAWNDWTADQYKKALEHPIARAGFKSDFDAMRWADTCVMVLPCGRSANSEAGWMKGAGKSVYVLQLEKQEPELMYSLYDGVITSGTELFSIFAIDVQHPQLFNEITTNSLESAKIFKKAFGDNFNVKSIEK